MSPGFQTTAQKTAYVRNSIPEDTWRNQSGASILKELQELGVGIREKTFYDIRRKVLDLYKYEEQVKGLRPDTRVPRAWMSPADDIKISNNYMYRFRVSGIDPETGEQIEKFFARSVSTDMSKSAAEALMLATIAGEEKFYDIQATTAELFHVYKRP